MKVQTQLELIGTLGAKPVSVDVFDKIDKYAKDWGLFSGINQIESSIPYSKRIIKTSFTFKSLFESINHDLARISFKPNEFLRVAENLRASAPLTPSSAYVLVLHDEVFFVLRTYQRTSTGVFELHSYKLEDPDSWAPLDSLVITRSKSKM